MPSDTNSHGNAFGGRIISWMDMAAAIAAGRHAGGGVVTVAVDELVFRRPIREGDVVVIRAGVNYAGTTSMEVGIRVECEDAAGGFKHCLSAYFTFVAVDNAGRPQPVPAITPQTELEKERFEKAQARRERRLASRR